MEDTMDVLARADELTVEALRLKAARLAERDLGWWAKQIVLAASYNRKKATDESRFFIRRGIRRTAQYHQALSMLLGGGFVVSSAHAWTSTGVQLIEFECVEVAWR